jgi:cytochrome oxidase Cu insertion factor (SCO1/SenC/PrrC family)
MHLITHIHKKLQKFQFNDQFEIVYFLYTLFEDVCTVKPRI